MKIKNIKTRNGPFAASRAFWLCLTPTGTEHLKVDFRWRNTLSGLMEQDWWRIIRSYGALRSSLRCCKNTDVWGHWAIEGQIRPEPVRLINVSTYSQWLMGLNWITVVRRNLLSVTLLLFSLFIYFFTFLKYWTEENSLIYFEKQQLVTDLIYLFAPWWLNFYWLRHH